MDAIPQLKPTITRDLQARLEFLLQQLPTAFPENLEGPLLTCKGSHKANAAPKLQLQDGTRP